MIEMKQIEALEHRLAHEFHPEQIILFGSYAYGQPIEYSECHNARSMLQYHMYGKEIVTSSTTTTSA